MSELISQLTSSLGIAPSSAEGASGAVLSFLKDRVPGLDLGKLTSLVPEASSWVQRAQATGTGGAGGGGLMDVASGLLGGLGGGAGQLAELAPLMAALSKFGIDPSLATRFLPIVLQFLQGKLGSGGLAPVISTIPALAPFLSGTSGAPEGAGGMLQGALGKLF